MTTRPQDIEEEAQHWREYDRQQREAAARTAGAWDHADEPFTLRSAREIAASIVYAITAIGLVVVILAFGFLS
jgi:hypothetical protein